MIYLKKQHFPEWFYLSTIAIFNAVMLISSPLIGKQIDKGHLIKLVYMTAIALGIFNICFYQIQTINWFLAITGLLCWGIQRASAQIVFASLVFNSVEKENYGTAIGIFYICSGIATMLSSFICGYLANDNISDTFLVSGFFALLALVISYYLLHKNIRSIASESYA